MSVQKTGVCTGHPTEKQEDKDKHADRRAKKTERFIKAHQD